MTANALLIDPAALPIESVMTRQVLTARRNATVLELESATRKSSVHRIVIAEHQIPVGVVCRCQLARARGAQPAWQVMTGPVITIFGGELLAAALAIFDDRGVSSLPVVDRSGRLAGIVTRRDLRRAGALQRERCACFTCGTSHGVRRVFGPDDPGFCDDCLARSKGDPEFGLYGTLGGGG